MAAPAPFAKAVSGPILRRPMDRPLYMDAEIRPHRSLSERGFIILIAVVTLANCASAAVFLRMGAIYVPFFLGVDVLAIAVAFIVSFRAARQVQRVQVTARDITVTHETPKWKKVIWESPTAFTRVTVERQEGRALAVRLTLSGRELAVAQSLSPRERGEFANALEDAIRAARSERS